MPDVAYYYPAPYWSAEESGWVKSLLLFFDRVAILLPGYMHGRHAAADPTLVEPLEDMGLLEILEPGEWVDKEVTAQLVSVVGRLLEGGVFDDLPTIPLDRFAELSRSRLGYTADVTLSKGLIKALRSRGLATASRDGMSVPLHPMVRSTILVLLAQLARGAGSKRGVSIHPASSDHRYVRDLVECLSSNAMPSAGHVVASDMESVAFDLSLVPLDEVLDFRSEHHDEHRAYMQSLRGFVGELSQVSAGVDRDRLELERRQEIDDAAHQLRRRARLGLGKNLAGWSIGIAGAAWALHSGDALGDVLAGSGLVAGMVPVSAPLPSAYSYLFSVDRDF